MKLLITKADINNFAVEAASRTQNWKKEVVLYLTEAKKLNIYKSNIAEELLRLEKFVSYRGTKKAVYRAVSSHDEFGDFYDEWDH